MNKEVNNEPEIKVSKKYGVNPSMERCFFCGEVKGIAVMGELPGDVEAPKFVILDYEPCDKCKEQFAQGVTCVEVQNKPITKGQMPLRGDLFPTARVVVMKVEAAIKLFSQIDELYENLKKGEMVLIGKKTFEQLFTDELEKTQKETQEDK